MHLLVKKNLKILGLLVPEDTANMIFRNFGAYSVAKIASLSWGLKTLFESFLIKSLLNIKCFQPRYLVRKGRRSRRTNSESKKCYYLWYTCILSKYLQAASLPPFLWGFDREYGICIKPKICMSSGSPSACKLRLLTQPQRHNLNKIK